MTVKRRKNGTPLLAALAWTSLVRAEPAEVRANLEVRAPAACGASSELVRRVERRSDRIRFVESMAGARRVRAEVRAESPRDYRATLSLWSEDGRELVRELRAADCAEAFDALALVIAVTLDPDLELVEEPPREVPKASEETRPAEVTTPPDKDPERELPEPAAEPRELVEIEPVEMPTPRTKSPLAPSFGFVGVVRSGPAPMALPGFGVFVGVDGLPGIPDRSLIRLSALRHGRSEFEATGGVAEFKLDALRIDACPFGLGGSLLRAYFCLEAELGQLEVAGLDTLDAHRETRPWRSIGTAALLAFSPIQVLELGLLGALEHPLVRDTFQFEPRAFHEVGPIGGRGELTLGVRLP